MACSAESESGSGSNPDSLSDSDPKSVKAAFLAVVDVFVPLVPQVSRVQNGPVTSLSNTVRSDEVHPLNSTKLNTVIPLTGPGDLARMGLIRNDAVLPRRRLALVGVWGLELLHEEPAETYTSHCNFFDRGKYHKIVDPIVAATTSPPPLRSNCRDRA